MAASDSRTRWLGAAAFGFALLFCALIIYGWSLNFSIPNYTDYVSFWAAGKLTLLGDAPAAYDYAKHRAIELTVVQVEGVMPFPYPPPFLLIVTPFSLLPYAWGFAVWVVATAAFYTYATRKVLPLPYNVAHPSVLMNGLIGQNGFLTAGIFGLGTALLRTRPFIAGAILGILVIKPQLGLLLPVALVAAREWRAVAGAALCGTALLLLALIVFGAPAYEGFFRILPLYTEMMRQDSWSWNQFISTFAFLRYFDVDLPIALAVHGIVAVAAMALTWIAWSRNWQGRVPVLAAATLLVPPYLLTYDALLLIIPMGFWLKEQPRPYVVGALWFLCMLPIAFYFHLYSGPNTVPIAAVASLAVLAASARQGSRSAADMDDADLVRI